MQTSSTKQLWILAFLTVIGTLGVALPYPIFAPLLLHPEQHSIIPASWNPHSRAVLFGTLLAMYPLGLFIGSPALGGLSDQYGRRPLIILSLFAATIGYILSAIAIDISNIFLLLFSRFFTGFAESNIAIIRGAVANMPDIDKHYGFGLIGAATTFGYVIGPLIGGVLSDPKILPAFNYATPFYFSACIVFIAAFLALAKLKEVRINASDKNQSSLIQRFNILSQLRYLCRNQSLKLLFLSSFFFFLAVDTYYEFFPAYLVQIWHMGTLTISILTAILATGIMLGNAWFSRLLNLHFETLPTVLWNILCYIIMLSLLLITGNAVSLYYIFGITGVFIGIASNHLYVHTSKIAQVDEQGQTLGMATGLRMLGDAGISFAGGFMIILSVDIPLVFAILMATVAVIMIYKFKNKI